MSITKQEVFDKIKEESHFNKCANTAYFNTIQSMKEMLYGRELMLYRRGMILYDEMISNCNDIEKNIADILTNQGDK